MDFDKVIPFASQYLIDDVMPIVFDIVKSHGQYIHDGVTGEDYLDCAGFYGSNPIGHNHPKLNDEAFCKKLLQAAKTKPANSDFFTKELAEFVEVFLRVAMPSGFQHLFFISGGALAVENALKAAIDWRVRKNISLGNGCARASKIIHFQQAFHGRSGYTVGMTNTADPRKTMYFPKFDWPRVINPKLRFPISPEAKQDVERLEKKALAQIEYACERYGHEIAGLLIETIQGEGGDNHFRSSFFKELRAMADHYDFMLIFDEVQCGTGITGKMWAFEHHGVAPDMIAFGKKMQVCGVIATKRIDEVEKNVFREASRINSTWGGDLCDMVRAQRYLEVIEEDELLKNAGEVGSKVLNELQGIESRNKPKISNSRGVGLMIAFDLEDSDKRDLLYSKMFEKKVVLLKCGTHSLRIRPSLNFSIKEAEIFLKALEESLQVI